MRVHLDTDFGGDPDDACALSMMLGWPDVEIVGITTNLEVRGRRAGCASYCLGLVGRHDIAVAAGAETSLTNQLRYEPTWGDPRYWPEPVVPRPSPPGAALDLLSHNIARGATIVAIGALTNLALLELMRPGSLHDVPVVAMGGWVRPPGDALPRWGPEMDFNVQSDTRAAEIVAATAALTLVTLPVTMRSHLRVAHLPRLRAAGPLGELLALQSVAYAEDNDMEALGRAHKGLPDDLLNFHWDPVTCAVALGWPGAVSEPMRLATDVEDAMLRFHERPDGRSTKVVVDIDAEQFTNVWFTCIEATRQ